jgi:hypothetical protein
MKNLKTHYGQNGRVELKKIQTTFILQLYWQGEVAQTFGYDNERQANEEYKNKIYYFLPS